MYIKRNIKARTTHQNSMTVKSQQPKLVSLGLGHYVFPKCDEVPPGVYYSQIKHAEHSTTRAGDPAVEVYYVMRDARNCKAVMNGWPTEKTNSKKYCIKQVYPKGTRYYKEFTDSMAAALGIKRNVPFDIEDTIGQTEMVKLAYNIGLDIGGFDWRYPFEQEDFIEYPEETEVEEQETDEQSSCGDTYCDADNAEACVNNMESQAQTEYVSNNAPDYDDNDYLDEDDDNWDW